MFFCSFCGLPGAGRILVKANGSEAFICGGCAWQATNLVRKRQVDADDGVITMPKEKAA